MHKEPNAEPSFARWHNLNTQDIEMLADDIVAAYNKVQDSSDGSAMFPGELQNLIMRITRSNSEGKLDVCIGTCLGFCNCTLPMEYDNEQ